MDHFELSTSQALSLPLCENFRSEFQVITCQIRPRDLSSISKWQPLVEDAHSSKPGISERLNLGEEVKGDERGKDGSWSLTGQACFTAKSWAEVEAAPSLAELVYRHPK